MCYYNGQKVTHDEWIRLKHLEKMVASYDFLNRDLHDGFVYGNVAVMKPLYGVKFDFEVTEMEWGFLPNSWYGQKIDTREKATEFRKGKYKNGVFQKGITMLNAIGEELLLPGKKYREAALHRRCLMLSSGFYEWHHYKTINKRTGLENKTEATVPHYITLPNRPIFYMAAVYKPWLDKSSGLIFNTVANVTTSAKGNKLMEFVHNSKERMPTILPEELAMEWLFGKPSEQRITELATYQCPASEMAAWAVDKKFKESLDPSKKFVYPADVPCVDNILKVA